jgi:glycosyltransferase involved in cell wall biosynthesis
MDGIVSAAPEGPLVTVAVPTYQRHDMLRQAIGSALAQTYRNIEVLVSDSAADPAIATLVDGFGDARLRYRDNGGVSDRFTNAKAMYRAATGELIATLHDDDLWEPYFLELLVPPLVADPEVVVAFGDHSVIDADGTPRPDLAALYRNRQGLRRGRYQPFYDLATTVQAIPVAVSAVFRAAAIDWDEWPDKVGTAYDLWLAYLLARNGDAAWYEPAQVSHWRHHPTAASSLERGDEEAIWCFERFLADERLRPVRRRLHRAAAPHYTGRALVPLHQGGRGARRRAGHDLRMALRGGLTTRTAVACALWSLPLGARRWAIVTAGETRSRRRARGGSALVS